MKQTAITIAAPLSPAVSPNVAAELASLGEMLEEQPGFAQLAAEQRLHFFNPSQLERLTEREDRGLQNHFVAVSEIKDGWFSRCVLRLVLRALNVACRLYYNHGDLAQIGSIHFARFVILPDQRRLLFISNYDGGFASYLELFSSAPGTTAVWANTKGFPRSFFLLGDGARDEQRFKAFGRREQVKTLGWWTAYPNLSVQAIDNATATREDLSRPIADDPDAIAAAKRAWRCFHAAMRGRVHPIAIWRLVSRELRAPLDAAGCDRAVRRLYS